MYLWKYWRESRIIFWIVLALFAVFLVQAYRERANVPRYPDQIAAMIPFLLYYPIVLLCLLGWIYGSRGVGRDLGEKSGAYLFTRPRPRSWFVWHDWCAGMTELLFWVFICNLVNWLQIKWMLSGAGGLTTGIMLADGRTASLARVTLLIGIAIYLAVALIFSLTYLATIMARHSRGIIFSAGIVIGYIFLAVALKQHWPSLELPNLFFQQFKFSGGRAIGFVDHQGSSLALRAFLVLLFPIASQAWLRRADI